LRADEEARVGWVWTAVVAWCLLAGLAAVLMGRTIHRADQEELEVRPPDLDVHDVTCSGTHPQE
jgi:hypothetical protein